MGKKKKHKKRKKDKVAGPISPQLVSLAIEYDTEITSKAGQMDRRVRAEPFRADFDLVIDYGDHFVRYGGVMLEEQVEKK